MPKKASPGRTLSAGFLTVTGISGTMGGIMNYLNLIIILLVLLLLALVLHRMQTSGRKTQKELSEDPGDSLQDLNEKFLAQAEGRQVIELVKVYNHQDKMILRSILDARGIPTYVKSNNFGELYPTFDLNNFATSVISLFETDREEAVMVVKDYLDSLNSETRPGSAGGALESGTFAPELLV